MSTAEKLTYLNDTKQLLKENINNLGGNLTNEPFRQYASVLEGIYERLPKVSGIGTSLSLSPSMAGKIKLNEIQGNTLQENTPTPDTPVPIQSVTGLQNVEVCGKNLFDKDNATYTNGSINDSGEETTSTNSLRVNEYIEVKPQTNYICSYNAVGNSYLNVVACYDETKTFITRLTNIKKETFVTPANTKYVRLVFYNSAGITIDNLSNIQLEQNNVITTYEPYKGNTYEVNLGKNLFDKNNYNTFDGYFMNNIFTSNNYHRTIYIPCKPNTTYIVNKINKGNNKRFSVTSTPTIPGNNLSYVNSVTDVNASSLTYTTGQNDNYLSVWCYVTSDTGATFQEIIDSLQIFDSNNLPIELNKIGDYEDSIKKSNGKNLFDINANDTNKGIDYSFNGSELSLNGTTTGEGNIYNNKNNTITLKSGTYTFSTNTSGTFSSNSKDTAIYLRKVSDNSIIAQFFSTQNYKITQTFTLNEDTELYMQLYTNGSGFVFNNFSIYFMLNEGSTALPYEPYGKVWYIEKQIGKVVLNGSESDSVYSLGSSGNFTRIGYIPFNNTNVVKSQCDYVSNYYKYLGAIGGDTTSEGISNTSASGLNRLFIFINSSTANTIATFKTWLSTHNTTVLYQLATPTYTTITNEELIEDLESLNNAKSEDGTTNIVVTSENLPMIINASALKGED